MSQLTAKQLEQKELMETIEQFISIESPEAAVKSFNDEAMIDFLKKYYLSENLVYDDEIAKRTEEADLIVGKELEANSKPPYSQALVENLLNLCKMSIMDEMVELVSQQNKPLQDSLKAFKITDFEAAMTFQMSMGAVMQKYMMMLAKEVQNECTSRGLDAKAFMRQAYPVLTSDMSMLFEIDSFCGLKNFEKIKDQPVTKEQVLAFSKQTIDYTKLLLESKIHEAALMVYPSLMNQYLNMKFGIDSYQVMAKIMDLLKKNDHSDDKEAFRQLLEEIWYVENGRAMIFAIFQQQMEMLEMMSKGGMDPSQMPPMDPAMMEAMSKGQMPPIDPAMMEALSKGQMPPLDPAMMEALAKGQMPAFDPAMLQAMSQGGMPPFDPAMMQGMDPAMMFGANPEMMDPRTMEAMAMGMEMGNQMKGQFNEAQLKELQEALQKGDLAKIESMMPANVKDMLDKMKNEAENKK